MMKKIVVKERKRLSILSFAWSSKANSTAHWHRIDEGMCCEHKISMSRTNPSLSQEMWLNWNRGSMRRSNVGENRGRRKTGEERQKQRRRGEDKRGRGGGGGDVPHW